ncbi:MAG: FHA domain-containing protein [Planctomycetota bacterium]
MLILIIAGGPDKGRIYELHEDTPVVLGREGDPISLNDRKCSRQHAKLWADGGKWYLQDLDSTHGTFRNHKKIDHRTEIKDGDYLQVGSTVMVMARMNALMAERAALLGDPEKRQPVLTPKTQKMLIAGGAIAAAVLLGLNVATYFQTSSGTANLSEQLAAVTNDPNRAAFEDEVRTMLADGRITAEQMSQTLAALGPDQDRFRRELGRQLDTVLAAVENDEQAGVLVAKLDGVLNAMRQQGGQTAAMADRVLAALDAQPTPDQIASTVARAVQPLDPQVAADLTAAAERLASAETVGSQVAELRTLVEELNDNVPAQLAGPTAQISQVLAQLETLNATGSQSDAKLTEHRRQLAAALDTLRGQLPPDPTGKLDAALAKLDKLDQLDNTPTRDQLDALTGRIDQQLAALPTRADLEALDQRDADRTATLSAMLGQPDEQFAESLADLRTQLAAVSDKLENQTDNAAGLADIPSQLAVISQRLDDRDNAASPDAETLGAIQTSLAEVRTEIASLPRTSDTEFETIRSDLKQIGDTLASRADTAAMQQQLTGILAELKDRDDAGLIKQQLEALADNRPAAPDPVLAQILASVQERAEAQVQIQTQTQKQLDALTQQVAQLDGSTFNNTAMANLVDAIVAKLPEQSAPLDTDTLLAGITEKLTDQQLASADALREMIRGEVLAAVDPITSQVAEQLQTELQDRLDEQALADAAGAVSDDGLTRTEQAYKLAFQTGQVIAIGSGPTDPQTGLTTPGRKLDPAAARAAGIDDWREWYLMDDAAHRMRLARVASRVRGTLGDPSVVSLPDADMIYSATTPPGDE